MFGAERVSSVCSIFSTLDGGSIYRVTKADGGNVTLIRKDLGENLKDLKAFDKTRQVGEFPEFQQNEPQSTIFTRSN